MARTECVFKYFAPQIHTWYVTDRYTIFFSSQKPPNNTRPQKKGREWKKEWGPAKTLVSGDSLLLTPQAHSRTSTHKCTHTNTCVTGVTQTPSVSHSHTENKESLWGRCVISMSPSLVVKTAKHRMLGLHAAVLSPTEQRNHGRTLRRACWWWTLRVKRGPLV